MKAIVIQDLPVSTGHLRPGHSVSPFRQEMWGPGDSGARGQEQVWTRTSERPCGAIQIT